MRRLILITTLALGYALAQGQSVESYLKLRTKQHIVLPISSQALDALIGTKIVELQGIVQGSCKAGESTSLMVKRDDDRTQVVDCPEAPAEWLMNGEVPVRMLVRVTRNSEYDALTAEMIAAAPDGDIQRVDNAYWRKEAAKMKRSNRSKTLESRGALHGWIGKPPRGSRIEMESASSDVPTIYAQFIKKRNPRLSDAEAMEIANDVIGYSLQYGIDARLPMAVLIVESDFDPNSTSHSGAMGLGQLMPGTATWMRVSDPYNIRQNLYGTIKLLRTHLDQYRAQTGENGNYLALALAAYNAGEGAVRRHGGVPPYRETQAYVRRVIEIYNKLCGS